MVDLTDGSSGRKGRSRTRTRASAAPTRNASVRERAVAQAVPVVQSSRAGLEGLGTALSGFFQSSQNALGTLAAAEQADALVKIDQENKLQRAEGIRLAEAGEDLTEEQEGDLDFFEAFTSTKGGKIGGELALEFSQLAATLPLSTSREDERALFIEKRLKNGFLMGTGNPIFDVALMSAFKRGTDRLVSAGAIAQVKEQLRVSRQEYTEGVALNFENIEANDLPLLAAQAKALHPDDPAAGNTFLARSLIAAAGFKGKSLAKLSALLHTPGSGALSTSDDTQGDAQFSFAEKFPLQMDVINAEINRKFLSAGSIEGLQIYRAIDDALPGMTDAQKLVVAAPGGKLDQAMDRFGNRREGEIKQAAILRGLQKSGERTAEVNSVRAMADGTLAVDKSLVAKHLRTFLAQEDANPLENPGKAAALIQRLGGTVSPDIQADVQKVLSSFDPAVAEKGFEFLQALVAVNNGNVNAALSQMDSASKDLFLYIRDTQLGRTFAVTHAEALQNIATAKDAKGITLKVLTGADSEAKAFTEAAKHVNDALPSVFDVDPAGFGGGKLTASPGVIRRIVEGARLTAIRLGGPNPDLKAFIKRFVMATRNGLTVAPSADGEHRVVAAQFPDDIRIPGFDGATELNPEGVPRTQPRVPFSVTAPNPAIRDTENTIGTFVSDTSGFFKKLGGSTDVFGNALDANSVSLVPALGFTERGLYTVQNDNGPVLFFAGQELTVSGETVTLPSDPKKLPDFLRDLFFGQEIPIPGINLPSSRFVLNAISNGVAGGFSLSYRPGFVNTVDILDAGLDEREAGLNTEDPTLNPEDTNPTPTGPLDAEGVTDLQARTTRIESLRSAINNKKRQIEQFRSLKEPDTAAILAADGDLRDLEVAQRREEEADAFQKALLQKRAASPRASARAGARQREADRLSAFRSRDGAGGSNPAESVAIDPITGEQKTVIRAQALQEAIGNIRRRNAQFLSLKNPDAKDVVPAEPDVRELELSLRREEQSRRINGFPPQRRTVAQPEDQPDSPLVADLAKELPDSEAFKSGSTTTGGFMRDLFSFFTDFKASIGQTAPSTGVTKPSTVNIENSDDLFDAASEIRQDHQKRVGGNVFESNVSNPDNSYRQRRFDFLSAEEGARPRAYDDKTGRTIQGKRKTEGNVTVGIGFNMDRPESQEFFTEATGRSDFGAVKAGTISLNQDDIRRLFDFSARKAEEFVNERFKDVILLEHQRLSLMSLAFNSRSLIGPNLTRLIKEGNGAGALNEILFKSNLRKNKGVAGRRYREAAMFAGPGIAEDLLPSYEFYLLELLGDFAKPLS